MGRSRAGRSAVTITTVAERAGVSKSSVSRYLQNSPRLSANSRDAIRSAIEELGYRPSDTARSLSVRRTNAIGVLANELRRPWFVEFMNGLGSALHEQGYFMFIGDGRLDRQLDTQLVQAFMAHRVDGLVIAGPMPRSDLLVQAVESLPSVVVSNRDFDELGVDMIAGDDAAAARLATTHLLELGHREIVHLSAPEGRLFELRAASFLETMEASDPPARGTIETCDSTEHGGYNAGRRILDVPPGERPTAVFASNDLTAMGLLAAARDLGVEVGGDLAVVSIDDTFLSAPEALDLTSVDNRSHEQGVLAAHAILQRLGDPEAPRIHEFVSPRISVRSTSCTPRRPR